MAEPSDERIQLKPEREILNDEINQALVGVVDVLITDESFAEKREEIVQIIEQRPSHIRKLLKKIFAIIEAELQTRGNRQSEIVDYFTQTFVESSNNQSESIPLNLEVEELYPGFYVLIISQRFLVA